MPPITRRQPQRRSSSAHSRYAIIFAVVGSVILISGLLWGYFLPKWRRKRQRPVQTRYNSIGGARKQKAQPDRDLELPVLFPPHPAVVVPLKGKRQPKDSGRVPRSSSIPLYDPLNQSPFPNTPRAGCSRPLPADVLLKYKTAVPATKPTSQQTTRLHRSQSHNTPIAVYGCAFPSSRSTSIGHARTKYAHNNSTNNGRCSFLVARSAGAPPARSKAAGKTPEESRHHSEGQKVPTTFSENFPSAITASDHQRLSKRNCPDGYNCDVAPGDSSVEDGIIKEHIFRDMKWPSE